MFISLGLVRNLLSSFERAAVRPLFLLPSIVASRCRRGVGRRWCPGTHLHSGAQLFEVLHIRLASALAISGPRKFFSIGIEQEHGWKSFDSVLLRQLRVLSDSFRGQLLAPGIVGKKQHEVGLCIGLECVLTEDFAIHVFSSMAALSATPPMPEGSSNRRNRADLRLQTP